MNADGGPAFPTEKVYGNLSGVKSVRTMGGMTLRDYFAGQEQATYRRAVADGPLARLWEWLWWGPNVSDEEAAEACYAMADAMLAERDK